MRFAIRGAFVLVCLWASIPSSASASEPLPLIGRLVEAFTSSEGIYLLHDTECGRALLTRFGESGFHPETSQRFARKISQDPPLAEEVLARLERTHQRFVAEASPAATGWDRLRAVIRQEFTFSNGEAAFRFVDPASVSSASAAEEWIRSDAGSLEWRLRELSEGISEVGHAADLGAYLEAYGAQAQRLKDVLHDLSTSFWLEGATPANATALEKVRAQTSAMIALRGQYRGYPGASFDSNPAAREFGAAVAAVFRAENQAIYVLRRYRVGKAGAP
jgi:hypothetical protein